MDRALRPPATPVGGPMSRLSAQAPPRAHLTAAGTHTGTKRNGSETPLLEVSRTGPARIPSVCRGVSLAGRNVDNLALTLTTYLQPHSPSAEAPPAFVIYTPAPLPAPAPGTPADPIVEAATVQMLLRATVPSEADVVAPMLFLCHWDSFLRLEQLPRGSGGTS